MSSRKPDDGLPVACTPDLIPATLRKRWVRPESRDLPLIWHSLSLVAGTAPGWLKCENSAN
jgi:hypothetical protein